MSIELYTTNQSDYGQMFTLPFSRRAPRPKKLLKYILPPLSLPTANLLLSKRPPARPPLAYTYKVCIIKSFEIQYHKAKNAANKLKHQGVSLAETEPVFYDERALMFQDNHHDEQRWIIIGLDAKGRLLVVAYTYRDPNFVRIISARIATKNERRHYMEA